MANLLTELAILVIPGNVFWPYCAGLVILILGLTIAVWKEMPRAKGADKVVVLGYIFFAAPMATFGAEHLTAAKDIATGIPHWIPAHLFWTWLVGFALIAAALSIVVKRYSGLAASLLGLMLFCFVLIIHVPRVLAHPGDRIMMAVILRDLAFSAGAFALASTVARDKWRRAGQKAATAARYIVGAVAIFFGVQHYLHPQFVPVVPLGLSMPSWIPFHYFWAWSVGAALLAGGLCMIANWHARLGATWLGIVVCAVVLLVYLPILVANPGDIGVSLNYFADTLAVGGNFLIIANSIPEARVKPKNALLSGSVKAKLATIESPS